MRGILTNTSIGRYGRFANALYQIAAVIGIAREQGFEWELPRFVNWDHKERFGSVEDADVHSYLAHPWQERDPRVFPERHYPWGYHAVQLPMGNWDLRGHFQDDRYFKRHIDEVRYWLTFKDEPELNDYVAIHYRAGDYIDDPNAYHPRCSREYYQQAMAMFPGRKFMLFSDDPHEWLKMFGYTDVIVSQRRVETHCGILLVANNYIDDFKAMKSCHSFVTANSSYSLMAATLANQPGKQIVCPKRWFGQQAGITFNGYPSEAVVI